MITWSYTNGAVNTCFMRSVFPEEELHLNATWSYKGDAINIFQINGNTCLKVLLLSKFVT